MNNFLILHYLIDDRYNAEEPYTTACGIQTRHLEDLKGDYYATDQITCIKCLESQAYKEAKFKEFLEE